MRDLVDASTCFPLPSNGYRGRPLREPCGSPPSRVLWVRTTARLPLPAASGLPWWQVLLAEGLFASLGTPLLPRDLWTMPTAWRGPEDDFQRPFVLAACRHVSNPSLFEVPKYASTQQ